jgi:hypothetical protein
MKARYKAEETAERIKRRRTLYRSLARRGVIREDPSLKQVGGSLYDGMRRFVADPNEQTDEAMREILERWYAQCSEIYDDPQLEQPQEWMEFLDGLERVMKLSGNASIANNLTSLISDALMMFPMELMAVDEGY